jgi:hypothetical protein
MRAPDRTVNQQAADPSRRWRRFGLRLTLAGISLLIALAGVEAAFRITYRTPWYAQVVQEQTKQACTRWTVGRITAPLRRPLPETPKDPQTYRILFLGDSFTYGHALTDESAIFVNRVVDDLNARRPHPGIGSYEVFNGGMPGTLTKEWVILFEDAFGTFDPDLVVAVFFLRDAVADITSVQQIHQIRDGMAELAERSRLFRWSCAYRYFRERHEQNRLSRDYLGRIRQGYFGSPEHTQEWRAAQANLLRIDREARLCGKSFAIVIFPVLFALDDDYPLADVCQTIAGFCHDNDIPVLDLLPTFMNRHAPALWISPCDQHPNELGHALAADAIYDFLCPLICADAERHREQPAAKATAEPRSPTSAHSVVRP